MPRIGMKEWDALNEKMSPWWGKGGAKDAVGVAPLAVGRCGTGIVQLNLLSCRIFERLLEDFCFGESGGSSGGDFTRSENKVPGGFGRMYHPSANQFFFGHNTP